MALDRRQFLAGMGAAGAAMLARLAEAQQAAGGRLFRIDTHAHFTIPKMYDLAMELVSVGAYVPNVPSTFPHSNPAATNIVLFFSPLANSVRWPGEAPF